MEKTNFYIATLEDLEKELWLRKREKMMWTTKDGKLIPLKEMSTRHILNAINYLETLDEMNSICMENQDIMGF